MIIRAYDDCTRKEETLVDETVKRLGDRLGRARESMGFTLQHLADLSGVAPSTIQKIEAGTMMPSIAVMMKIARGLHKKIGFFLDEEEAGTEVSFVRKRDRAVASGLRINDFSAQSLTTELIDPEMDGFILTLPPGVSSGEDPLDHRGEELVFCIRGRVTFTINGKDYTLGTGDSLHFKSDLPHFWKNTGRSAAELVIVCSLPALSEKILVRDASGDKKGVG